MKTKLFLAAAVTLLLSAPLAAQWIDHKAPGIPRTPDGKPNLSAPAPRTADGKPDLSGIWRGPGNSPYIRNIAVDLKPNEIEPWAQQAFQQHVFNLGADSPRAHCLPDPPPFSHLAGLARVVQTPALTVIINEAGTTRTIHTDGRGLPEDPNPAWLGYSVGRWEGDTLVVSTNGFNDRTWLDFAGHPHSEALRTMERFHRRDFGHMDVEMTLEDPKTFAKPITFKAAKTLEPDTDILERICEYEKPSQHLVGTGSFRLTPDALAKYAGTYEFGPGHEAVVTVDGETLALRLSAAEARARAAQPEGAFVAAADIHTLVAQSETTFISTGFGERVEFAKDASGAITGLTYTTGSGLGLGTREPSVQKGLRKGR